ncbi:hypothetical protein [Kitasatospora xanthocidica]|uniref:hypothetical protein n=1 Tax=Kitasatospora xanthocidica TaxID=83382 RepID=UPI001675BF3F|nr:hypothetical protein [Kitasatospora xanthocidica]GHF41382.1 hypothetical protein GCM10018790_18780 [Kitasatospora xanthocidica]
MTERSYGDHESPARPYRPSVRAQEVGPTDFLRGTGREAVVQEDAHQVEGVATV